MNLNEKLSGRLEAVLGFWSILILCLAYAIGLSNVAEYHWTFSFLPFPIFIGEIVLFFNLLLFSRFVYLNRLWEKSWSFWILFFYFIWLLYQAAYGYWVYGPMALRHAAFFYYPLFAIMAYSYLKAKPYSIILAPIFITVVLWMFLYNLISAPFMLTIGTLTFLCLWFYQRYLLIKILLFLLAGYVLSVVIVDSRSMFVGVIGALLVMGLFAFVCIPKGYKRFFWLGLGILISLLTVSLILKGDKSNLKSMFTPQALFLRYQEDKNASKFYIKKYIPMPIEQRLYNENNMPIALEYNSYKFSIYEHPANRALLNESVNHLNKSVGIIDKKEVIPESKRIVPQPKLIRNDKVENKIKVEKKEEELLLRPLQNSALDLVVNNKTLLVLNPNSNYLQKSEENAQIEGEMKKTDHDRDIGTSYGNILFRIFIWEDMLNEIWSKERWWGMGFGYPQRSRTIEALNWAYGEWRRDGWIAPHNSFLHYIYRAGLLGLTLVIFMIVGLYKMIMLFLAKRNIYGMLLCSILVYWMLLSQFLLILEMPYTAIPIWFLVGITVFYYQRERHENSPRS